MKVTQLILHTSAINELSEFYAGILALPASRDGNTVTIKTGSTKLVFKQAEAADPFYHVAFNIPCNKIEEARQWLIKKNIKLLWMEQYESNVADFVNWHAKSVYFHDPAGNILELIARFDLDNKTGAPFSPAQFLSVSEVGLVFKPGEFDSEVQQLLDRYPLSYFDKQPPLPQFKAIGDDEGLFIVVPEKREWYPTSQASGIFPMEVEFVHNSEKYKLSIP